MRRPPGWQAQQRASGNADASALSPRCQKANSAPGFPDALKLITSAAGSSPARLFARALPEQNFPCLFGFLRFVPQRSLAPLAPKGKASPDRRAGANPLEPVLEMGEVFKPLALVPVGYDPAPGGHVSDRITARKVVAVLEAPVHDAIEPVHLIGVTPD